MFLLRAFILIGITSSVLFASDENIICDQEDTVRCSREMDLRPRIPETLPAGVLSDRAIITSDDIKFCENKLLKEKNANITPDQCVDDGSVWRVGNRRWNNEWEEKYVDWVKNNLTPELFSEIGLATDCADAVVATRAIFSRIYNLPASFLGTKYSNFQSTYKTHNSPKVVWNPENWKEDFKNDRRFKAWINDVSGAVGSVNLSNDVYPIKIINEATKSFSKDITFGTVLLHKGHVEQVCHRKESKVNPIGVINSTVPAKVRDLETREFKKDDAVHDEITQVAKWNWIVNCEGIIKKVQDKKMPGYSPQIRAETLSFLRLDNFSDFRNENKKALNLTDDQVEELLAQEAFALFNEIEKKIKERENVVKLGKKACTNLNVFKVEDCFKLTSKEKFKIVDGEIVAVENYTPCDHVGHSAESCLGSVIYQTHCGDLEEEKCLIPKSDQLKALYSEHSTPNRDERLKAQIESFTKISSDLKNAEIKKDLKLKSMEKFIELSNGKKISYNHLFESISTFSPQPWHEEEKRWGAYWMPQIKIKFEIKIENYEFLKDYNAAAGDPALLKSVQEKYPVLFKEWQLIEEYFKDSN